MMQHTVKSAVSCCSCIEVKHTCTLHIPNVFHASSTESTRQRAYSLVAQAYTSIAAEDFAAFVGYSVEEAVKGMRGMFHGGAIKLISIT